MSIGLLKDIAEKCPKNVALLGLDVGKKTIGLALSDPGQRVATPLLTIPRTKFTKDMEALKAVIAEYEVGGFIIGYPLNMDGSEGPRAQSVRDFAVEMERYLKQWCHPVGVREAHLHERDPEKECSDAAHIMDFRRLSAPSARRGNDNAPIWIALWDERLSTVSVESAVDELVQKRKTKTQAKASGLIDKLAAQVILQSALDFMA